MDKEVVEKINKAIVKVLQAPIKLKKQITIGNSLEEITKQIS